MPKSCKHSPLSPQAERLTSLSFPAISRAAVGQWFGDLEGFWRLCVCLTATVLLLAEASSAHAQSTNSNGVVVGADRIATFVAEASQRFAMPPSLIRAVIRAESLDDVFGLSPKGAMGLMRIMPDTWSELRSRYGFGT
jgi:soluble lytic murein transglycosylase-like protein